MTLTIFLGVLIGAFLYWCAISCVNIVIGKESPSLSGLLLCIASALIGAYLSSTVACP